MSVAHLSLPPAIPTTRQPNVLAICPATEPEPVYAVRFAAAELFGEGDHTVTIDLWESYLQPVAAEPGGAATGQSR